LLITTGQRTAGWSTFLAALPRGKRCAAQQPARHRAEFFDEF